MAVRVTPAEVRKIVETDDVSLPDLVPFITASNTLVNRVCLASGYAESHLKEIEKWLAAHFYCQPDPRAQEQEIGDARDLFEGKTGMFLTNTRYGQMAILLDDAGNLAALNNAAATRKKRTVKLTWLGDNSCCDPDPNCCGG